MRCLHCGKRLTILRKLSDHEFCSEEHRAAFGREQEQLALSRLIDAQQQSQQVNRRREKEKKKAPEIPSVELASVSLARFVGQMPGAQESGWQGCRKDDSELMLRPPDLWVPRLQMVSRTGQIPAGEAVWPDIRVEVRGDGGVFVAITAEAEWHGHPGTLEELAGWCGQKPGWTAVLRPDFGRPDFGRVEAAEGEQQAGIDFQVIEAGVVVWPAVVNARPWAASARKIPAKPVAPRTGWAPEAFPRLAMRLVAAEVETRRGPAVRAGAETPLALAAPAARREPARWVSPEPRAEWIPATARPRFASKPAARLARPGCRSLSLERLACGSYRKIELQEAPVSFPAVCLLPRQDRRQRPSRLRLVQRVPIGIPQANWGWHLATSPSSPEPSPAFLVPPRSGDLPHVDFNPPFYGQRQLRLSARCDQNPEQWRRQEIDGPFVPVPAVAARPVFSAPLLCDWVPVRARMMELNVEIAPRGMAGTPGGAEPAVELVPPATSTSEVRSSGLPLRAEPSVKARATGLRRLSLDGTVPPQSEREPKALLDDEPIAVPRLLPGSKLRPVKDRPTLEIERRLRAPAWKKGLIRVVDVWDGLSGMTKLSGALMSILLAVFAAAPSVGMPGGGSGASVQATLAGGWDGIHRNILDRAAVALTDDFRAGLADWEGEGNWAQAWSYDQSGFVRTGPMALYTPSLGLTNYRMEFLGQIEKRSIGWVVRAADRNNYYAVKLVVAEAGPVPDVLIQRYAVIQGRQGPVKTKRLPLPVRMDTLYRVQMEVRDADFSLSVQEAMVDSWSEPALRRGGIGFFSAKGELARLRWVGVWHQYDMLGRLCALLAPQSIADRERGASQ